MRTQLNQPQIDQYEKLAALARQITLAISDFNVEVCTANIPDEVKTRCLDITSNLDTFGLAYRLTPQSEWTGGESFKVMSPHIANE